MKATPRRDELIGALTAGYRMDAYIAGWDIRIERVSMRPSHMRGYDARYIISIRPGPVVFHYTKMHWKGSAAAAIALASKWYLVGDDDWTVLPLPVGADAS